MPSKWVQEECSHFHWLLTHLVRKNTVFANHTKTGAVSAQLMSATKKEEKHRLLPSIVFVHLGLSPNLAEFRPKDMLSRFGAQNDFFLHICVNIGAGQLCVNRSARTADKHFCCRFIGSTLRLNEI